MKRKRVETGTVFGSLTVIGDGGKDKYNHFTSVVKCKCGNVYTVPDTELIYGRRKMCRYCNTPSKTHGMTNTRLFHIWQSMIGRCTNPNNKSYKDYGTRGVVVCESWKNSFEVFHEWAVASGYADDLSIDRIDVNGDYTPENCRWSTPIAQARNKRNTVLIEYKGVMTPVVVVAEKEGIPAYLLRWRKHAGWTPEQMLAKPVIGRNNRGKCYEVCNSI